MKLEVKLAAENTRGSLILLAALATLFKQMEDTSQGPTGIVMDINPITETAPPDKEVKIPTRQEVEKAVNDAIRPQTSSPLTSNDEDEDLITGKKEAPKTAPKEITEDELITKVQQLAQAGKRAEVKKLFTTEFGAATLDKVDKKKYNKLMEELNKL